MNAALSQASRVDKSREPIRAVTVKAGGSLDEQIFNLANLPSRKELENKCEVPAPLSKEETKKFSAAKENLEKTLSELNLRLSNKLDPGEEQAFHDQLKTAGSSSLSDDDLFMSKLGGAAAGIVAGVVICKMLGSTEPNVVNVLFVASLAVVSVGIANLISCMPGWLRQNAVAKKEVFDAEGSPPARNLNGFINPFIKIKALFYKGPSSSAAIEFDEKLKDISTQKLTPEEKAEQIVIAKEGLQLQKERTQAELSLVSNRLSADTGTEKASLMMGEVVRSLSIPPSADRSYLEETVLKTKALIESLEKFKKDSGYAIPPEMTPLKYFSRIISLLDKSHVSLKLKETFFETFTMALEARIRQANMVLGRFSEGGIPDSPEAVP